MFFFVYIFLVKILFLLNPILSPNLLLWHSPKHMQLYKIFSSWVQSHFQLVIFLQVWGQSSRGLFVQRHLFTLRSWHWLDQVQSDNRQGSGFFWSRHILALGDRTFWNNKLVLPFTLWLLLEMLHPKVNPYQIRGYAFQQTRCSWGCSTNSVFTD